MRTTYRAVAVTGLLAMCATGMSVLGAGSASAAAAADIPLDSCTATVQANAGDHVVVSAQTLLAPQLKDLGAIPLVGPLLVGALNPALATLALPPLAVQQLPSGEFAPITGAQIADQLAAALPVLPPIVVQPLRDALTKSCTVPVVKKQIVVAPVPAPAPESPAPASAPESPVALPSVAPPIPAAIASAITSYGYVPKYSYSDLTSVPAAGADYAVNLAPTMAPKPLTGYGLPTTLGQAPLSAPAFPPQFGLLTAPTAPAVPSPTPSIQSEAVQQPMMSEVTALPVAPDAATRVPAEAVLAALLLSLTTAALVRTWVLRRSAG